ncbi:MAG: tyrosine-type recombinase/integrase, partial [Myxococcota bacterium]
MFADFLEVARARLAPGSYRHYDRALRRFCVYLADRHPHLKRLTIELLGRDVLEAWFGSLVASELAVSTSRLYVTAVSSAWTWAYDSDTYGDLVRRPRRIAMPVPAGAPARAPTWEEMDRAIWAAYQLAEEARAEDQRAAWTWRARLCTLLRFTGLRVDEQAMRLRWDDVDLDRGEITIRGELGKSDAERAGRIVPVSPHLVETMKGWGVRE